VAASHCDQVELFLNGRSLGVATKPGVFMDSYGGGRVPGSELLQNMSMGFVYSFPHVAFAPGTLRAVASKSGRVVAQEELKTAGEPRALRLTVHTGPHGLQADGADVALVDFEAVDAEGNRCPTDEARVDFTVEGPATWRGGINSAVLNSTNNLYLSTECGINRAAIRSTLAPGTIVIKATRDGLAPATVQIESHAVEVEDGLGIHLPPAYRGPDEAIPLLVP
jgi:beta-galactosidase